ncbi:MAG: hypothetical protein K2N05_08240 [Muribaculaceae bacterium]|nr:hypothetical protein [Muribaculaceae bacterium]
MRTIYLTLISVVASGTMLCSCNGGSRTSVAASDSTVVNDSLPANVSEIVKAVANRDSATFSAHVNYPLERPYPLKDIKDEKEMQSYYNVMVDDSLKNVIAKSGHGDWSESGWRGWTVKDGQYLWIDGDVYEVNYLSNKEKNLKDSLVKKEKASLPPALAKGWTPEWVMEDITEGTVYRIDADSVFLSSADVDIAGKGGEYRLSVYMRGGDLRRHPEKVIRGRREVDGSVGNVNYYFDSRSTMVVSDSAEYIIELYSETGAPRLYHRQQKPVAGKRSKPIRLNTSARDTLIDHELKKVYWLDKMNNQVSKDSISNKQQNPNK